MFTGIIESIGKIESIAQDGSSLSISCPFASELALGESVAVNGTCLTVSALSRSSFSADATPETFRRTALGSLVRGAEVNLERAMPADGRFGGHIVSGHVDGTAAFLGAEAEGNAVNATFRVPPELGELVIEKGSVAVDGVSLTVARIERGASALFSVAVIPHTWKSTTLSRMTAGASVNIECDIVGKYIRHFLSLGGSAHDVRCGKDDTLLERLLGDFPQFH